MLRVFDAVVVVVVDVVVDVVVVVVREDDDEGCHFPREKLALKSKNDDGSLKPTNNSFPLRDH